MTRSGNFGRIWIPPPERRTPVRPGAHGLAVPGDREIGAPAAPVPGLGGGSQMRPGISDRCRESFAKLWSDGITATIMSAKKLQDKIAIITGASKGLGKAMALALAEAGAKLALVSRNLEQLKETAAAVGKFGTYAEVFTVDVTDEQQVRQVESSVL